MMDILSQDIMYLAGVGPHRKDTLASQLGIRTWGDLMEYYPYKYVDRSKVYLISELTGDMPFVQIKGKILSFETLAADRRQKRIVAHFSDGHGVADLVWFRGGQYALKNYKVGEEYIVFGKPTAYMGRYQFAHPEMERAADLSLNDMGMQPYYMTTEKMKNVGMTSHTIGKLTKTLVGKIPEGALPETLLPAQVSRLHLISREDALRKIHYPRSLDDVQRAQVRLKFEELFYVQLNILRYTTEHRKKYQGYVFAHVGDTFNRFYRDNLPFELTGAQKRVMHEIRDDLRSGRQMNRLLQGDVGSGKTLVALMAMLLALDNGFQACMMAPTEILAEQHLTTLHDFLKGMDVRVELLTGIVKGKRRRKVLEGLADGSVDILVGTHAIIEDNVVFRRLGMAVVDEQHRFGVEQRESLNGKGSTAPHLLVMTATPIPRTAAMTWFGDLDISWLTELPGGRKPIRTFIVPEENGSLMAEMFGLIRHRIDAGERAYVVCPRIDADSEDADTASGAEDAEVGSAFDEAYDLGEDDAQREQRPPLHAVAEIAERLRSLPQFAGIRIATLTGRDDDATKTQVMADFESGKTPVLVATTVIEVGVDVAKASCMVIFDADRYGLSQLHQLRGRVGRGGTESGAFLISRAPEGSDAAKRLEVISGTLDGAEIAQADLEFRGAGDVLGDAQSGGKSGLKLLRVVKDVKIIEDARAEAQRLVAEDPALHDCVQLVGAVLDFTRGNETFLTSN
ncbi:MAG TPA: ATP-dependent DNA helicase RecG [Bifidobacterium sp.]|nr:ATP-dependent DNA helicase RecG [Bifidobacterium sp.]